MSEMDKAVPSLRVQSTWLLSAKLAGFAIAFAMPLLVVRFLAQHDVGLYRQSFQVVMNAVSILPFGFSMSAFYFLSRHPERARSTILNILIVNFAVGALAFLVLFTSPELLGSLFRSAEIESLSPLIGAVIWLWITAAFLEVVAVANREPRVATLFIITSQLTKTLLMATAVIVFSTVEAFLYAAMAQGSIQIAVLIIYLSRRFPKFWTSFDPAFFREQMVYAIPFGVASMVLVLQTDVHNYFVGYKFSLADYAIYAYGCFQLPVLIMLHESINSVLIPRISQLQMNGSRDEIVRLSVRATEKLAFVYFPVFAFLIITAPLFIGTLFTDKYSASTPIFMINLLMLLIDVVVLDAIFRAHKDLGRKLLYIRISVLAVLFAVLYFGLDRLSLTGIIAVVILATLGERIVSGAVIAQRLELGRKDLRRLAGIARTAAASFVSGLTLLGLLFLGGDVLSAAIRSWIDSIFAGFGEFAAIRHFVGGSVVLTIYATLFGTVYLFLAHYLGLVDVHEKDFLRAFARRLIPVRKRVVEEPLTLVSER